MYTGSFYNWQPKLQLSLGALWSRYGPPGGTDLHKGCLHMLYRPVVRVVGVERTDKANCNLEKKLKKKKYLE
jgi:hypothetical protein